MGSKSSYAVERAGRADMVDVDQAAALAGVTPTQLRRLAALKRPRVIAVEHAALGLRFPRWQFDGPVWPVVQQLGAALQGNAIAMLAWLETPLGVFQGRTPRVALEQGEPADRVLAIAVHCYVCHEDALQD